MENVIKENKNKESVAKDDIAKGEAALKKASKDHSHIKGWGIDANPENDPTYPIKHRTDEEQKGYTWNRPTQQPINVEILHSNERPNVSAVFGTSVPPSGLSGSIRRFAFKYSESSYGHWLPLLVADRINVVEGILDDLKRGHIPNIFAEKGGKATWKYNKKKILKQALVATVLTTAIVLISTKKAKGKKNRK